MNVRFLPASIASGSTTELIVTYASDDPATLLLDGWDPDHFTVTPTSFPLPAAPEGRTTPPPTLRVQITRHTEHTLCGIHFVLDTESDFSVVEVT